jgi:hypothetical protein
MGETIVPAWTKEMILAQKIVSTVAALICQGVFGAELLMTIF